MAWSTAAARCCSLRTSQWMKVQRPGGEMEAATRWPSESFRSAMTTAAPWATKRRVVVSPIPLAPPVMMATFPSSLSLFKAMCEISLSLSLSITKLNSSMGRTRLVYMQLGSVCAIR
ncbi:hypothetical protein IEQ34_022872 [Dendrobium chrysotoxum]|uniref:Uncharacterized protein n=1 Tax=Dendrobium chrysotoxum TaxID=161865 RepID=A0AAV7G0P2_DENCH|nr:hypothetical protein IEQ34_022872 [Dendrobium chrysotoxum]